MDSTTQDLLATLEARGFVHQTTDRDGLARAFASGPVTGYLGFDATADSLHVGHLQGLMLMRWLQRAGHPILLLIGGATTRIGDPSFRDSSRPVLTDGQIALNMAGIAKAFHRYLEVGDGHGRAQVVDNAEWLDGLGYLNFLGAVGRHFSINRLLTFDAIRNRLDREHSLSFEEFGYTLLQAYDFVELSRRYGCTLQLGGADQWANIINGVELSRRQGGPQLHGLTMPLLATRDGRKMGKSAQGAVWLNEERLSAFDFWQFWRNCDDADVERFLALFTELPLDEVRRLAALGGRRGLRRPGRRWSLADARPEPPAARGGCQPGRAAGADRCAAVAQCGPPTGGRRWPSPGRTARIRSRCAAHGGRRRSTGKSGQEAASAHHSGGLRRRR